MKYILGLATINPHDPTSSPRNIVHKRRGIENSNTTGKSRRIEYFLRTNIVVSWYAGRIGVFDNTKCLLSESNKNRDNLTPALTARWLICPLTPLSSNVIIASIFHFLTYSPTRRWDYLEEVYFIIIGANSWENTCDQVRRNDLFV